MTFVYFIANERSHLVKIGTSTNPKLRLVQLQVGSVDELVLVAVVPGDERYEAALHKRFAEYRVIGEWFAWRGELRDLLNLIPSVDTEAAPPRIRAPRGPKPTLTGFAARLSGWLEHRGMNQAALARAVGVSTSAVAQWTNGSTTPSPESMDRIVGAFETTIAEFWGDQAKRKARAS